MAETLIDGSRAPCGPASHRDAPLKWNRKKVFDVLGGWRQTGNWTLRPKTCGWRATFSSALHQPAKGDSVCRCRLRACARTPLSFGSSRCESLYTTPHGQDCVPRQKQTVDEKELLPKMKLDALMRRLRRVKSGHKFTREEMNKR